MRIAMLIPSLGGGGAERIVLELASSLTSIGNTVDVFLLERVSSYAPPPDVNFHYVQNWRHNTPLCIKGLSLPLAYWRLDKALKLGKYDVVVSHMERCSGLLLFRPGGIPGMIVVHNFLSVSLANKNFIKKTFAHLLYSFAAKQEIPMSFVAEAARRDAGILFPLRRENTVTLPNFIDIKTVSLASSQPLPKEWEVFFANPVVINIGRLTRQKGQWHLVRAFKEVVKTVPGARLLILGEGELRHDLEKLVFACNLEKSVLLPGFCTDIFSLMRHACVYAMPSLYEGMPMSLLEALACGCAIVSTDCPSGPREVLADDTSPKQAVEVETLDAGLLCPRLDGVWREADVPLTAEEHYFAEALIRTLTDKDFNGRIRNGAKKRSEYYSRECGARRWQQALGKIKNREKFMNDTTVAPKRKRKEKSIIEKCKLLVKMISGSIFLRRCLIFVEHPISALGEEDLRRYAEADYDIESVDSLDELKQNHLPDNPATARLFKTRLANKNFTYYPTTDKTGKLIAQMWLAYGDFFEPTFNITVPVAKHEVHTFSGYLEPGNRQGFQAIEMTKQILSFAVTRGRTMTTSLCDISNRRSLHFHYSAGYKERMQSLQITKLFGIIISSKFAVYETPYLTRNYFTSKKK